MKKLYTVLSVLIISSQLFAGGFQINEHGAKAMGMGGAFTAVANDASAIYWNGAGLTQIAGTQLMLGTTLISPMSSFKPASSLQAIAPGITEYKTDSQVFFPTHFFAAHNFKNGIAVGLGFTSPFGLGVKWGDSWIGKYLTLDTELKVFTISPVIAYKLSDQFSLSAGFIYSWADVTLTQKAPIPATLGGGESLITLKGNDNSAFGYSFGLLYKPLPELSLGASFHSQLKYSFSGTASSTNIPAPAVSFFPNGNISADITAPYNLAAGIAYKLDPKFLLSLDFQYVGWSSYDTLKVDFASYSDISSARSYDNSFILRLGGEYQLNNCFSVLAGIYYDKTPVKAEYMSPQLPEGNRLGFSAGFEYAISSQLSLSGSYLYIHSSEVNVTNSTQMLGPLHFDGSYSSNAHLGSLTLQYSF